MENKEITATETISKISIQNVLMLVGAILVGGVLGCVLTLEKKSTDINYLNNFSNTPQKQDCSDEVSRAMAQIETSTKEECTEDVSVKSPQNYPVDPKDGLFISSLGGGYNEIKITMQYPSDVRIQNVSETVSSYYPKASNQFFRIESSDGKFSALLRIGERRLSVKASFFDYEYEPLSKKFYQVDELPVMVTEFMPVEHRRLSEQAILYHLEDGGDAGHGSDIYFMVHTSLSSKGFELTVPFGPCDQECEVRQEKFLQLIDSMIASLKTEVVPGRG